MKVTKEKEENHQVYLTIELEADEVKQAESDALDRITKRAKLGGFRAGKAPRAMVERVVDKDALRQEALDKLIPEAYEKALKEQNIEAVAQPEMELTQKDPVIFKATVPLKPTVTLGDYKKVRVEPKKVEVTEEQINAVIERLRHQHALWEPAERPVALNDFITFDVSSSYGPENKPFINTKKAQYNVTAGLTAPLPGFPEALVDAKKNEEKEFKLKFPEDYADKNVIGQEVTFKVTITEIKAEQMPELNDEFAKRVDTKFETVAALREQIAADLKQQQEAQAKTDFENEVIEAIAKDSQVHFPHVMVESEIHSLMEQQERRLQQSGVTLQQYLASTGKNYNDYHESLHPVAEKRIAEALVLGKVVEEEKIAISEGDIDSEIEGVARGVDDKNRLNLLKSLNTPESRRSIRSMLLSRKAIARVTEIARGNEDKK